MDTLRWATRGIGRIVTVTLATAIMWAAALAPTATPATAATAAENLGQPISNYLVLDTVMGKDASGKPMLYGSTYVVSREGVYFFAVDPVTGDIVKMLHMTDSWGGYHVDAAPDGKVYLAPLEQTGKADLWMYDPQTDIVKIVATVPNTSGYNFLFGVTVAPWNKVYVGAAPSGRVYEYDPKDGSLSNLGVAAAGVQDPKALIALPGKRLLVGDGAPAHLIVYDIASGQKREVLPPQYAGWSFAYNVARVDNDVFVQMVVPGQRVLHFNALDMSFLGEMPAAAGNWGMSILKIDDNRYYIQGSDTDTGQTGIFENNIRTGQLTLATPDSFWAGKDVWWVNVDGQRWVTSIGTSGDWARWNPATGQLITHRLALPGSPTSITALQTGPDGKIYGGTYETNALFSYDPATNETQVFGPVAKGRSGEILSMASAAGKLFMGSYTYAVLTVFDPTKPWNPGTDPATSNPVDLGSMGDQQYRPWDMVVGDDGKVYAATGAAYGVLGGALTQIDPTTYEMHSWRYLAGQQNLFSLAAGNGEIYVGSTDHGDTVEATGDAQLLVWNEASHAVTYRTTPVTGASAIEALATGVNGKLYGTTENGQWFSFDPATHAVTQLGAFPLGTALGLKTGPDGSIYGHTSTAIFRIDPATAQVTKLADTTDDTRDRTDAFDSSGRLYWGSGPALMRMTP
jgi:streptogramin lyase